MKDLKIELKDFWPGPLIYCKAEDINFGTTSICFHAGNYPWPSEPTHELKNIAIAAFEYIKAKNISVRIVMSNHWATEGYWVEVNDTSPITNALDSVIKEFKAI